MCFFWKRRKIRKQQEAEALKKQEEEKNSAKEEVKAEEPKKEVKQEEVKAPVKEEVKPAAPKKEAKKAAPVKKEAAPIEEEPKDDNKSSRYAGKYEIYPEAGMFKFRLKASNGEILIVSNAYTSIDGAKAGIDTMKKNIKIDNSKIITDKNNFSQFRFLTANSARVVVSGEYYNNLNSASSALDSTKKFAFTDKVVILKSIPASEVREEKVALKPIDKNSNGKIELFIEDKKYYGRLIASNGELLFVTEDYSSKAALIKGLKSIEEKVSASSFDVVKDKQNRYQFKLYSPNGQQLLVGQTYSTKDSALSAIDSVRRFLEQAKTIDLTLKPKKEEKKASK